MIDIVFVQGSEAAMEGDRQFPYQEEMRSIFAERMERLLKGKEKVEDEDEEEEEEEEEESNKSKKKKRRKMVSKGVVGVEDALREFGRRQMEMEMRWMVAAEEREAERRLKEEEWRREMVAFQEERMAIERRWRESEEERRARQEERDERRHALVTAILSKIGEKWSTF